MISYIFNNNKKINTEYLLNRFVENFDLDLIDKNTENIVLGNSEMLVDVSKKYINVLLFNDNINIKSIKEYLLEKYHG